MTKRQIRLIVLSTLLLLLLLGLAGWFWYYRNTKQLAFNLAASAQSAITPPQFMYSFSGSGANRMQRPIGIVADGGKVYVADSLKHTIYVYSEAGDLQGSFGTSQTVVPLYMAKNPKNGDLYVSDRRARAVKMFTTDGKYLGVFNPHLPKDQLPKFKTGGVQWEPVALAFADDGTMYATETLNGHRLLIFNPDGTFKRSIGDAGIANVPTEGKLFFQFPNGLMVVGDEVFVADSNNRRIQVFDRAGNFKRIIVTQGLPRGITQLDSFPADDAKSPGRFVEVDTLAHDATIWTDKGEKVLSFGEQGILDGQFSYPDGVAKGTHNRLFITDTANGRVQVWGWPAQAASIPAVVNPRNAWMCLLPLLLLPLLLLFRKRRFVVTPDFVFEMIEAEDADLMPAPRRAWLATPDDFDKLKDIVWRDIRMGDLIESTQYSESDAEALIGKLEIDRATAGELALAQRGKVFCTESPELRRLAKTLEIDVVNTQEFARRFPSKKRPSEPAEAEV